MFATGISNDGDGVSALIPHDLRPARRRPARVERTNFSSSASFTKIMSDTLSTMLARSRSLSRKRLRGLLALGDVLVCAEDADDAALLVDEWQLAGSQPASGASGPSLRFVVRELWLPTLHDRPIVGDVFVGKLGPGQVVVGLADDLGRVGKAGVAS